MIEEVFEQIIEDFSDTPVIGRKYKVITDLKKAGDLITSPAWCSYLEDVAGDLGFKKKQAHPEENHLAPQNYTYELYKAFNERVYTIPEFPICEAFHYYLKVLLFERLLKEPGIGEEWFKLLRNKAFPCGKNTIFAFEDSPLYEKNHWLSLFKPKSISEKYAEDIEEVKVWLKNSSSINSTPVKVNFIKSFKKMFLLLDQKVRINLFEYQLSDGSKGRAFTGPLTWSFLGDGIDQIKNEDLIIAYCGWFFLTLGCQYGSIISDFDNEEESVSFITGKIQDELDPKAKLMSKYKVADIFYLEFEGLKAGVRFKQAIGNDNSSFYCDENDTEFALPALYFMLGLIQQN